MISVHRKFLLAVRFFVAVFTKKLLFALTFLLF